MPKAFVWDHSFTWGRKESGTTEWLNILEKLGFSFNHIWHGHVHLDSNIAFLIFNYLKKKSVVCLHQRHINGIDFLDCVKDMRKEKEVNPVCNCIAFNILLVLSRPLRLGLCTLDLNLQCCKSTCVAVEAYTTYYWCVYSCVVAVSIFREPCLHPCRTFSATP